MPEMENMTCANRSCQSNQKWSIGNDVRTILLNDSAVSGLVGNKIYPLVAPENIRDEFIVYKRDKYSKRSTKIGVYEDECELFLNAVSDNYDTAISIASAVDNALTGTHIIDGKRINIELADSTEDFDDDKYIETLLFRIK